MSMNLREYAAHIFAHAEKLQSFLDSRGEKLGFEADALPSRHFPQELQESRVALMSACQTMYDLVEGAESTMLWSPFVAIHDVGAYKLLYHYRLWELVPEQGTISYEDMAKPLKLEVKRLTTYVRHLITRRIFLEPEPNRVGHSAASLFLARNEGSQCWLGACTDDVAEAIQALPETYDAHGLSLDTKFSPFNTARKDNSMGAMALVLSDKQRGPRYSKGLGWVSTTESASSEIILDSYPWEQFGLVVDVMKRISHPLIWSGFLADSR
jgi:6-hydroxytryprostatin B O-methyltransferase